VTLTRAGERVEHRPWRMLPPGLGLVAMYLPSYIDLARRFWVGEDEAQGPIILLIALWLLWRERHAFRSYSNAKEQVLGLCVLAFGLALYVVGRSQEFFQFDITSQTPVIIGIALAAGGKSALRRYWFPASFLLFLVPVPPSIFDQILVPLKALVSDVVTNSLYGLGFPISRDGVVIFIGQYQLLIADACSGLRSIFALMGIGLLYVYLMNFASRAVNVVMIAAAIPIAFIANVLRVMALVLITYYFGDRAGTYFHDAAGYFEIVLAFGGFFTLGAILVKRLAPKTTVPDGKYPLSPSEGSASLRLGFATAAMVVSALLAVALAPRTVVEHAPSELGAAIPNEFSNWHATDAGLQQVALFATDENGQNPMQTVYDDSFLRSYVSADGAQMMVAVAYDRVQREEDRVHRPEICYIAQGFHILSDQPVTFHLDAAGRRDIEGRQMLAQKRGRLEAVSYWIRIGDSFTQNPWRSRAYVLTQGLAGKLHDGILVRVSQVIDNPEDASQSFAAQERFLDSMLANVSTPTAIALASRPTAGGQAVIAKAGR